MKYQMTTLENKIQELYSYLSISSPEDIEIYCIAEKLDIWIHYWSRGSKMQCTDGLYSIVLDERKIFKEQRQDFFHELGHVIRHVGNQNKMYEHFKNLQEYQANNFMYHFCVPTFMLLNYNLTNYMNVNDGVDFVSDTFNVTKGFAKKRLVHFRNQWSQAKSDEEHRRYMESRYPKAAPYSDETNNILALALEMKAKKRKEDHQCQNNI
ncbi:ImmA/IrrE family metallo-endopeptidase [Cytobacillus sp. FJAT-53684]|uniref:ImmA/IrrE family metallo-endopeptidase n=1 Tax=Cytobacillus mangrovibacter TaxID=3299024 RepID=A0ABW6K185_9BACI